MKNILYILIAFAVSVSITFADDIPAPDSKPDAELTKKEAEIRINQFLVKVKSLEDQLNSLNSKYDGMKSDLENTNKALKDCQDEILRLVGATNADLAAFRQKLGVIEAKVRELQRLPDAQLVERQDEVKNLENDLNELRANKISILPEFYPKVIQLAKDIRGLYREKKITTYTVGTWAENKDCLWNIAGKIEIYADPFMWPKIWQGNTDIIRNPDIIHPGQVLTIPEKGDKTTDEIKAERRYWRNKKAAQKQESEVKPGGTN
ncbi:MAG TPA: LysM peptidoglycan-binding domain-containing protein [Candidatus Kapabacteria bacterium]|nr:LysM peptidoglycan-binding domain-containing protein [Candidatus Kapabacteria bacterium]